MIHKSMSEHRYISTCHNNLALTAGNGGDHSLGVQSAHFVGSLPRSRYTLCKDAAAATATTESADSNPWGKRWAVLKLDWAPDATACRSITGTVAIVALRMNIEMVFLESR